MDEFISYKSSSPSGDLISFMAGIKEMYKKTGKRGIVYQRLGMPGISYAESIHPFQNTEGEPICMNEYMFNHLRPLLLSQEYIEDYKIYTGEEVFFDFDLIRLARYTNQPKGSLNRYFNYVFPQMASDISKSWLEVELNNDYSDKIVINYTQRHRNHILNYFFLKPYQDRIIFSGLKKERDIFCENWGLDIPLLEVNDFLELAKVIKGCKLFMGNASMCFQLAEAMKVPRILETFPMLPNVIPTGGIAYDFYDQNAGEHYFNELNGNS